MTATLLILLIISTSLFIITCFKRQWSYLVDVVLFFVSVLTINTGFEIGLGGFSNKLTGGDNIPISLSISCAWIIILFWWFVRSKKLGEYLHINKSIIFQSIFWGLLLGTISFAMALGIPGYPFTIDWTNNNGWYFALVTIINTIASSASEEFIFRLLFSNHLKQLTSSPFLVVVFQGLVFGLIHLSRYDAYVSGLLFATCFGWFSGWLFHRQKSIWGVSLVHAITNLMITFWLLFAH